MALLGDETQIPTWVSISAMVLSGLLIPFVSWLIPLWLRTRQALAAADAAKVKQDQEDKDARDAQEAKRTAGRRAEDRREDERQGRYWRTVLDATVERHGKEISELRDRHDREIGELRDEIARLRVENEECRDNSAKQDIAIAVGRERQAILISRITQLEGALHGTAADPGGGSAFHQALQDADSHHELPKPAERPPPEKEGK